MSLRLSKQQYEGGLPYDLLRKENIAIGMAYFAVGIVGSLLSTPLNVYLVERLNAEPQMQNTIGILQTLPWSLKLFFGFLSDVVPICGLHRIPYLTIGSLVYSFAFITYSIYGNDNVVNLAICIFFGTLGLIQMDVMSDTMCVQRSKMEPEDQKGQLQSTCYSIRFAGGLVGAILGATICNRKHWGWGLTFRQVAMLNGLVPFCLVTPFLLTLKEKFHKPSRKEKKSLGLLELGGKHHHNIDSTIVIDEHSSLLHDPHAISSGYHSIPHVDIVHESEFHSKTTATASEKSSNGKTVGEEGDNDAVNEDEEEEEEEDPPKVEEQQSIADQLHEIWLTVQLRSVWRPMTFVFVFNLFQVPNVAWQSYLQLTLNFPSWVLGLTVLLGSFMTFAGVLGYKFFFFKSSWRMIYVWTVMLTTFFSMTQLLLIFQINTKYLHLHNYLFSVGGDVITAYISGIQFLPLCIMYMRLCPEGAEGASYAMLTTFGNIALVCACNLGNLLAGIWDVSNDAMRRHDVSGLWKLNLLASTLALLPLSLLFLLPRNVEEQDKLSKSKERSRVGGACFLFVLVTSLTWSITTAIWRVFYSNR